LLVKDIGKGKKKSYKVLQGSVEKDTLLNSHGKLPTPPQQKNKTNTNPPTHTKTTTCFEKKGERAAELSRSKTGDSTEMKRGTYAFALGGGGGGEEEKKQGSSDSGLLIGEEEEQSLHHTTREEIARPSS